MSKQVKITLTPEAYELLVQLTEAINAEALKNDPDHNNWSVAWIAQDIVTDYLEERLKRSVKKTGSHGGKRK